MVRGLSRPCTLCKDYLPPGSFPHYLVNICSRCIDNPMRSGFQRHTPILTTTTTPEQRQSNRLRKYKLTEAEYSIMRAQQENKCGICFNALIQDHIDHDHDTGVVRELLCPSCNAGLGFFKDSPQTLANAIKYLYKHNKPGFPVDI